MRCAKGDDRQTEEGEVWKVGRTDGWADWRDRVANTPIALREPLHSRSKFRRDRERLGLTDAFEVDDHCLN